MMHWYIPSTYYFKVCRRMCLRYVSGSMCARHMCQSIFANHMCPYGPDVFHHVPAYVLSSCRSYVHWPYRSYVPCRMCRGWLSCVARACCARSVRWWWSEMLCRGESAQLGRVIAAHVNWHTRTAIVAVGPGRCRRAKFGKTLKTNAGHDLETYRNAGLAPTRNNPWPIQNMSL